MSRWILDADGQVLNAAHVVRIRPKEAPDGTWSVYADVPDFGMHALARGLPSRDDALDAMGKLLAMAVNG